MNDQSSPVRPRLDPRSFIRDRLRVTAVPSIPEIRLYTAHPASGLWRLGPPPGQGAGAPPYWVYQWAGGMALARYILDRPETVAGLRVLDLGAGSGLVGIAAAIVGSKRGHRRRDRPQRAGRARIERRGKRRRADGGRRRSHRRPAAQCGSRRGRRPLLRASSCRARHGLPRPLPRRRDRGADRRSLPRLPAASAASRAGRIHNA